MNPPKPVISDANSLTYLKGWSYHDQLGGLKTHAPHVLPEQDSLPKGVEEVWEQEITRAGFIPTKDHAASYLYRLHHGPSWVKDGVKRVEKNAIAPHWVTGSFTSKESQGAIPRKYKALDSEKGNPLQTLKTLFYNSDINVGVSTGSEPMPHFFRNADGDDLFFVHEGSGVFETELGVLAYEPGHYVWVPKGIAYRIVPNGAPHMLMHMENYGEKFQKPETGFTGDAAVYYHRNIEVPVNQFVDRDGEHEVIVKLDDGFTSYMHPHHPMDVVGWDGTLFPFRLHIRDIHPITSWRAHIPPSAYCTFFGNGFEICSFVPRPVETGDRAIPVPFHHINVDRDEVIFYSQGIFFSKNESAEGTLTYHPRGFSHGPHPKSFKRAAERRSKEGAFLFEGYFVMVETNKSLYPTQFAGSLELPDYVNSWQ